MVSSPGSELLRRCLLGLITALIVARPLVAGADPGLTHVNTGVAGPALTLLWLLAAAGWGIWRLFSWTATWRASVVEVGLLVVTALAFLSAGKAASYQHPAWIIAWEWVGLLAAFVVVRQLVQSESENRALVAALLASGVSLAIFAGYQALRPASPSPAVEATLAQIFDLEARVPPPGADGVSATFEQSATFGAFLALLLPILVAAAVASWRTEGPSARTLLTIGCAGLLMVALFLAHAWAAIVVLLFLGVTALAVAWRSRWTPVGLAGLVGVAVLLVWLAGVDRLQEMLRLRFEFAGITGTMIREHPLLGVGPGNFATEYLHYLPSAAEEKTGDPHNFVLEIAATMGMFAAAAFLLTWIAFFWRAWPGSAPAPTEESEPPTTDRGPRTNWEFYLGGVLGLFIGFAVRFSAHSAGSMTEGLTEGLVALSRAVVWMGAFAVFDGICWTNRARASALTAGVGALLLDLLLVGGVSFPSVAVPLWVTAALALNAVPTRAVTLGGRLRLVALFAPVPFLLVGALLYVGMVFYPAAHTASSLSDARRYYREWRERSEPNRQERLAKATTDEERLEVVLKADYLLAEAILSPLDRAVRDDPSNAALLVEAAYWQGKRWQLYAPLADDLLVRDSTDRNKRATIAKKRLDFATAAVETADAAKKLDPHGAEGYLIAYHLREQIAQAAPSEGERIKQYRIAANNLKQLAEIDPSEPRWPALIAETLYSREKGANATEAKTYAARALELDEHAIEGRRRLNEGQRALLTLMMAEGR